MPGQDGGGGGGAAQAVTGALAMVGGAAERGAAWASESSGAALGRGRGWMEFCDLSALKLAADGGAGEYVARLQANAQYFKFNYLQVGLGVALLSTVTRPLCLVGTGVLVAAYFHLFGAESSEEMVVCGVTMGHDEKLGALVLLGGVVFWFAAGGLQLFSSIICATLVVMVAHGCLRVPAREEQPALAIP